MPRGRWWRRCARRYKHLNQWKYTSRHGGEHNLVWNARAATQVMDVAVLWGRDRDSVVGDAEQHVERAAAYALIIGVRSREQ